MQLTHPPSFASLPSATLEKTSIGLEDVMGLGGAGVRFVLFPFNDSNIYTFLWVISTCN